MTFKLCRRCGISATNHDEHHVSRRSKGNKERTIPLCRNCHSWVEANSKEAEKLGFMDRASQYQGEKDYHEK